VLHLHGNTDMNQQCLGLLPSCLQPGVMKRVLDVGVDALVTNYPQLAIQVRPGDQLACFNPAAPSLLYASFCLSGEPHSSQMSHGTFKKQLGRSDYLGPVLPAGH
jgi:hypothetical protein